jgi:hypothetical protein
VSPAVAAVVVMEYGSFRVAFPSFCASVCWTFGSWEWFASVCQASPRLDPLASLLLRLPRLVCLLRSPRAACAWQ